MAANDYIEIACDVLHQTADATLINDGTQADGEGIWIPKSQQDPDEIHDWEDEPILGTQIFVKEWLAEEKGLI